MYPVSAEFLEAVVQSHRAAVRAECWLGGTLVAEIPIATGSVSVDARRGALRTCALTVSPDGDRSLEELYAILATFGAELKLYRGVVVAGDVPLPTPTPAPLSQKIRAFAGWIAGATAKGRALRGWQSIGSTLDTAISPAPAYTTELVPLGMFVITDADYNDYAPSLTVNGTDRSLRITRARWTDPYRIAASTLLADALTDLLIDRWPDCPIGFGNADTGSAMIAAQVVLDAGESSDPWKDAQSIAEAHGFDLYFDGDGFARMRPVPDVMSTPAAMSYGNGAAAVVLDSSRRMTYEQTYTGVIATGEGTGVAAPVRGEAWDDDPSSPTYYLGPVGKIPYFYSSPLITTADQAAATAGTILTRVVGRIEQVAWSQIVNPAHDALDVVELTDSAGVVHRYVLDAITIPLVISEAMSATARETRTAA